jgi:transposase-like protein
MEPPQRPHDTARPGLFPTTPPSPTAGQTPATSPAPLEARRQQLLAYLRDADFSDEKGCYEELVRFLHPDGLRCPRCQSKDGLRVHRRHREPVLVYICGKCFRVFNAWTGTAIQGVHRQPSQIAYILRRVVDRAPTARIAREMGCHRRGVLSLRRRLLALISPDGGLGPEPRTRPAGGGRASPGGGEPEG